jgi:cysteine desulfurase / selenocysteine lyase
MQTGLGRLTQDPLKSLIRTEFSALQGPYLDVAARAPLPLRAKIAAGAAIEAQATGTIIKEDWFALVERVRLKVAKRVGATPDEIAFTKNVSEGLNLVAAALRLQPGDRIVTASAVEHPNNIFPWIWSAQSTGAELTDIAVANGETVEDALIAAIDSRTKLLAVTAVDFATGRRTDLQLLGSVCRGRGIFLLVDAAQSAGVLSEDLSNLPIDGWATATQKGLLGLYGLGLLYVRREWTERLRPSALARFSVEMNAGHEAARPDRAGWRLRAGAGRFEIGNYNYVALAAQEASLDLLAEIGSEETERRALLAADTLRAGLRALDVPLLMVPDTNRSHILAVGDSLGQGHDRADTAWVATLSASFKAQRIAHSVRRGVLRLSTHAYVSPENTQQVLECTREWRRADPR